MTDSEDISRVAHQLADLTHTVEEMRANSWSSAWELKINKNARTPNKGALTSRREN